MNNSTEHLKQFINTVINSQTWEVWIDNDWGCIADSGCITPHTNIESLEWSVCGWIEIGSPCGDIWSVKGAWAGKNGYGRYIYDLAYFLSPSHKLMADRLGLSSNAIAGWMKLAQKDEGHELPAACRKWKTSATGKIGHVNTVGSILPLETDKALNRYFQRNNQNWDWANLAKQTHARVIHAGLNPDTIKKWASDIAYDNFRCHFN